ncbi:MAG: protease modulator HflC, partial [Isosphaeraceae bacterium]
MHQVIASPPRPQRHRRWRFFAAILAILAMVALLRSFVIVDQAETVYLTEFGRPVRLIREPGLYFKWPHYARRSFDKRLQVHAPPPREMLTRDKKNLEVAWYLTWKIAEVDRFLKSVRTVPDASARLEDMAASVIAAELGGHNLADLVRIGKQSEIAAMMDAVTRRIGEQAAAEYGVAVSDCRLRRLNFPEEVRSAVFEQIRSERKKVAATTRAEGESQARIIKSAADLERARQVAQAQADAA